MKFGGDKFEGFKEFFFSYVGLLSRTFTIHRILVWTSRFTIHRICCANHWTGFYIIRTSVMKELNSYLELPPDSQTLDISRAITSESSSLHIAVVSECKSLNTLEILGSNNQSYISCDQSFQYDMFIWQRYQLSEDNLSNDFKKYCTKVFFKKSNKNNLGKI